MAARRRAGAYLTVDLGAIQRNYQFVRDQFQGGRCGAVVKADAYGLGATRVAVALAAIGVRDFFVAQLSEAVALREALVEIAPDAVIYDFSGPMLGAEDDYIAFDIRPVLNSLGCLERWSQASKKAGRPLESALHVDTGMRRLGLSAKELEQLRDNTHLLEEIAVDFIMSHLACGDESDHDMNEQQLAEFKAVHAHFPEYPASFANSAGILLGADYHFDLARPGIALYGGAPIHNRPNPLESVLQLHGRILQVREIDARQSVGYGAAFRASKPTRIATVALGYADGYQRILSNQGVGFIDGKPVPVVGRVSMDLLTFDVTELPEAAVTAGTTVEFIGENQHIDTLAAHAGTIAHEVLTNLGQRFHRFYLGA